MNSTALRSIIVTSARGMRTKSELYQNRLSFADRSSDLAPQQGSVRQLANGKFEWCIYGDSTKQRSPS